MSHALAHVLQEKPTPAVRRPPPLESGDRLTRAEFERRYDVTPGLKKAELLEGDVYMPPPPVSHEFHRGPHADFLKKLSGPTGRK